jgi:hypothetical protein
MTYIELIMEVLGSLSEFVSNFVVELQSLLDNGGNLLTDSSLELNVVLHHEGTVNSLEG